MTLKYESELIKDIVESRGHEKSSLHYESECVEKWIEEAKGAYPKLCDYQSEWLTYIIENPLGKFPYEIITDVTEATVNNVVPYAYKKAILYGKSETVDGTLQSVKMPVLTTTGKNLFDGEIEEGVIDSNTGEPQTYGGRSRSKNFIRVPKNTDLYIKLENAGSKSWTTIFGYDENKKYLGVVINSGGGNKTFNTGEASYIKWKNNEAIDELGNIQIEEGSTATTYEPFKSNIFTVNEDVTLRSNGNVCDELDLLTGKLTQRIDEDGSVLAQEVVKTVELNIQDQDGNTLSKIRPIEGTIHIHSDGTPLKPSITMEIPVEATTQNLVSFIREE